MNSITRHRYNRFGERTEIKNYSVQVGNQSKVKFEYMIEHKGVKVILTDHARKQAAHRHGMQIEQMKAWFVQAIDGIKSRGFEPKYYNQEVFIYNEHFKRGMIVAFRRDFRGNWSKRSDMALVAVTCYPYGKDTPVYADTAIIRLRGGAN